MSEANYVIVYSPGGEVRGPYDLQSAEQIAEIQNAMARRGETNVTASIQLGRNPQITRGGVGSNYGPVPRASGGSGGGAGALILLAVAAAPLFLIYKAAKGARWARIALAALCAVVVAALVAVVLVHDRLGRTVEVSCAVAGFSTAMAQGQINGFHYRGWDSSDPSASHYDGMRAFCRDHLDATVRFTEYRR